MKKGQIRMFAIAGGNKHSAGVSRRLSQDAVGQSEYGKFASDYSKYRPTYPKALFETIAKYVPNKHLAWDCATGNGQTAALLSENFDRVFATDISEEQLRYTIQRDNVTYKCEPSEECSLEDNSIDLVTVSTALHWFDRKIFYKEVQRVLRPEGVFAAWSYRFPDLGEELKDLQIKIQDGFESYHPIFVIDIDVKKVYGQFEFPFEEKELPDFACECHWDLNHLLNYYDKTNIVSERFHADKGCYPSSIIKEALQQRWGEPCQKRIIKFPLAVRLGLNNKSLLNQDDRDEKERAWRINATKGK